jgi:hypothetical protein
MCAHGADSSAIDVILCVWKVAQCVVRKGSVGVCKVGLIEGT